MFTYSISQYIPQVFSSDIAREFQHISPQTVPDIVGGLGRVLPGLIFQ